MKRNKDDTDALKLKKAKRAFRLALWLGLELPKEYHCMAVNLECCSMHFLKKYLSRNRVASEAEVLMVKKYLDTNPNLLLSYLNNHAGGWDMTAEILQKAPREFIVKVIKQETKYVPMQLQTSPTAQAMLVSRGDSRLFEYVILRRPNICESTITEIIRQQQTDMLRLLFKHENKPRFQHAVFTYSQQKLLLQQNNTELLECYAQHRKFDFTVLNELIEQENIPVLDIILKRQRFSDDAQEFLIKFGSKKMIAWYLQQYPVSAKAQIELIKRDYKDLLKLHYLKHGVADEALHYLLCLNNFKAYIGI